MKQVPVIVRSTRFLAFIAVVVLTLTRLECRASHLRKHKAPRPPRF